MPYDYGLEMVKKASDKEIERTAWELWLTFEGEQKNKTPFGEFLMRFKTPKVQTSKQTDEEVIKDSQNIIKMMKRSE